MWQRIASGELIPALKASFDHADARPFLENYQVTRVALEEGNHGAVLVIDQTPVTPSIGKIRHRIEQVNPSDVVLWPRWTLRTAFAENSEMIGTSRTYGNGQGQAIQEELERRIYAVHLADTGDDLASRLRYNPNAGAFPR